MNFILFTVIGLTTLIITTFSCSQIIGILFIKIPRKQYKYIIGLIFWSIILYLFNLAITNWFEIYFKVYLWCSIIALIITIINFNKLKKENEK